MCVDDLPVLVSLLQSTMEVGVAYPPSQQQRAPARVGGVSPDRGRNSPKVSSLRQETSTRCCCLNKRCPTEFTIFHYLHFFLTCAFTLSIDNLVLLRVHKWQTFTLSIDNLVLLRVHKWQTFTLSIDNLVL